MMPRLSKFSLFLTALCLASLPMRAESAEVTLEEARSLVVSSPRPAYPFEVYKRHESGSGTAVVTIDPATGEVVKAEMRVSTRNEMLDNAALSLPSVTGDSSLALSRRSGFPSNFAFRGKCELSRRRGLWMKFWHPFLEEAM